ncbi:MAG: hypothetical protein VB104_02605 [Candidatus Limiplasma sp.]|nr:hypothetical protein [Candidatus Limiplasma sp.]
MFHKPGVVPESRPTFVERCILPLSSDRRCLAVAALVSALLFALPLFRLAMAEEAQPTAMYVVGVKSWLNGRAKPERDSDVEARFTIGTEVDVYEVSGQWAKVAGGETGYVWCSVDYLSSNPPDSDPQTYAVRSNGRVRVRDTPDGELVRWLEDGDTVQVQTWFDGWAYIGDGYVLGQWPGGGLEAVE